MDAESFLTALRGRLESVHILAYVQPMEPWLLGHPGALTVFTDRHRAEAVAASEYHAYARENGHHHLQAFEEYCHATPVRHGLLSFADCGSVDMLGRQANAAAACAADGAVLVIRGVIPAADAGGIAPAAPHDDRWTFKAVLEQAGSVVHVVEAGPGGLLVAVGVHRIDIAAAKALADRLRTEAPTVADRRRRLEIVEAAHALDAADRAFDRQMAHDHVELVLDPAEPGVVSTEIDPFAGWTRPQPAFVADLSADGIDTGKLFQNERSIHGVTIDEFRDVVLIGRDLILGGPEEAGRRPVYGKNKAEAAMRIGLQVVGDEGAWDAATRTVARSGRFHYPRRALQSARPLDGPGFLGTPDEFFNFGMWLLYSVPGVRHFRQLSARYPSFLAAMPLPWQRRMLLDLGVAEAELVDLDPEATYRAPALATMRQTYRSLSFPPSDLAAFEEVAERAVASGAATPEKIFVSRLTKTRQGGHRGLVNEAELAAALEGLGFVAVEPETMPILHQARVFRNARAIVGLGGAAMFNTAFCRPGTRLVDIESGMGFVDAHANLFASRGLEYGLILGQVDASDPSPHQKRWSIDVAGAVRRIASFT